MREGRREGCEEVDSEGSVVRWDGGRKIDRKERRKVEREMEVGR